MDWPRRIDGVPEALTIEGLRRRLGSCPACGGGPLALLLGPARLSAGRKERRTNDRILAEGRPLLINCTAEACDARFSVSTRGTIHPSRRSRQEDTETRIFLPAFGALSGDGAELSFELADQADPWERTGISFEEAVRRLRATFDARRAA